MPSEHEVLVLLAVDVRSLLDVDLAIESQQFVLRRARSRLALLPPRLLIGGGQDSASFCYAARLAPEVGAVCKFGSVNPANADR